MKKVPPHPFKNFLTINSKSKLLAHEQTVDASVALAFAVANGQAPPRPCPLRELLRLLSVSIIPLPSRVVKKNRSTKKDEKRRKSIKNEPTCVRFCRTHPSFCPICRTFFGAFLDKSAFCLYNVIRNTNGKENSQCTRKSSAI